MLDDIKEYLSINLNEYENIGVSFEINKFLLLVAIGLCIAAFYFNYKRSLMVNTVKQLIRHNATGEDSAKTLAELGLSDSRGIKKAIFNDAQLRRMIAIVGESRPTYEEYVAATKKSGKLQSPDPLEARIYIPEGALDRAKHVYNTYSTSLFKTILTCVLFLAVAVCLILFMPGLLDFLNKMMAE